MIRRIILALIGVALLVFGVAMAVVSWQRPPFELARTDDRDFEVELHALPARIAVIDSAAASFLLTLELADSVFGVSEEAASVFPGIEELGPVRQLDLFRLVALRPDLVIVGGEDQLTAQMRAVGLSVFQLAPRNLDELLDGLTRLGALVEREQAAEAVRHSLFAELESIRVDSLFRGARPLVLFWPEEQELNPGLQGVEADLLVMVGGRNAAVGELTREEAIEASPDIIIAPAEVLAALADNPEWGEVPAVIENRLFDLPADFGDVSWLNVVQRALWWKEIVNQAG